MRDGPTQIAYQALGTRTVAALADEKQRMLHVGAIGFAALPVSFASFQARAPEQSNWALAMHLDCLIQHIEEKRHLRSECLAVAPSRFLQVVAPRLERHLVTHFMTYSVTLSSEGIVLVR